MADFFAELKRRHIYRVGAAYVVVAWALTQLVEILTQVFTLPLWIAQAAIVLLAIGFPVALLVAWTVESKPHEAVAAAVRSRPTIVDWTLCGALAVVVVLIGYQQIAPRPQARVASASSTAEPGDISVAVLPFVNLSDDREQEFFSDGMTDEIIAALAKIQRLSVVGRSSAFQFKGQNRDLRAIGQALGARYLIDGSVRKEGNRVRISAQLVQAANGVGVWTNSYDRELTGLFATQEDIATAIAGALRVPLGLQQGESLVSNRTDDLESYQQYLRARALYRARRIDEAVALLEPAVARDPTYAPARALLAQSYTRVPTFSAVVYAGPLEEARRIVQSSYDKAEMAAREAIRLDPGHSGGYVGLAAVQALRGRWADSENSFRQALMLDAHGPDAQHLYSVMLADAGRVKESLKIMEQVLAQEPFVPIYNTTTSTILQSDGQTQAAIRTLEAIAADGAVGSFRNVFLASAYAAAGRYREAADTLLASPQQNLFSRQSIEDAARLIRSAPAKASAPNTLPAFPPFLNFVYDYAGAPNRVMEAVERLAAVESIGGTGLSLAPLWYPERAALRKTERFKAYIRKVGLVEYWQARGWPDRCRPQGAEDFVCD